MNLSVVVFACLVFLIGSSFALETEETYPRDEESSVINLDKILGEDFDWKKTRERWKKEREEWISNQTKIGKSKNI